MSWPARVGEAPLRFRGTRGWLSLLLIDRADGTCSAGPWCSRPPVVALRADGHEYPVCAYHQANLRGRRRWTTTKVIT